MTRLARSDINPTNYWEDGDFLAYTFASELIEAYDMATTVEDDKMYWHNGRNYHQFGEQVLRGEVRALLADTANREIVNEVVRNVKHLTRARRADIFDLPPEKVVVANGVVDLITGQFHDSWSTPGTRTWIDVEYQEGAMAEDFNDFLFDVLHTDDVGTMYELIGLCLYNGYPFQKAALFLGEGSNGKSTLLNAIQEFLGPENVANAELHDLTKNRFATADLEGKLANIAGDLSSNELKYTGKFKELTGGDMIRAERKNEASFKFRNKATMIFSANEAPQAEDETFAYKRRWLYFEFPHTFSGDVSQREFLERFREEQAGILNMAIQGFQRLWERGGFETTVYQQQHEDAHERATSSAHTFTTEQIEEAEGEYLNQTDAIEAYQAWCEENGRQAQNKKKLNRAVRTTFNPDVVKNPSDERYKAWADLRLVESDAENRSADNDTKDASMDNF